MSSSDKSQLSSWPPQTDMLLSKPSLLEMFLLLLLPTFLSLALAAVVEADQMTPLVRQHYKNCTELYVIQLKEQH